jgi:hypothetical protein
MRPDAKSGQVFGAAPRETPYRSPPVLARAHRRYAVASALVLLAVVAGLAVLWVRGKRADRAAGSGDLVDAALAAVPHDSWLVVIVDIAALRQSPIAKAVLGGGSGAGSTTVIPGLGSPLDLCGFDPVSRLREVVVAAPEGDGQGDRSDDVGVAFSGDLAKDELAACAEKMIRARGGTPSTRTRGGYTVIEDSAGKPERAARVAYREGGPFLVGRGSWLDTMIDAAEGKVDRARPEHAALRAALRTRRPREREGAGAQAQGETATAIWATAVLPKALRERLKAELPVEGTAGVASGADAHAPDPEHARDNEPGQKTYASVLAVEQAALSVTTGGPGSSTVIAVELECETHADCESVRTFVERKRFALSRDLGVRVIGLGPLVDSLVVEVQGPSLSAAAHAPTGDLARTVERAVDLFSPGPPETTPSPRPKTRQTGQPGQTGAGERGPSPGAPSSP